MLLKRAHLGQFRSSFLRRASVRSISATAEAVGDCNGAAYGAGWDAGGTAVKIGVWWDFENCNVPYGIDAHRVGLNIVSGLRSSGFQGPVSISGYGDMLQLSRAAQESLSSTGIRLHHVPSGGKESETSDRALLMDLILWTIENPPPAHLFLISGDRDFSTALHKLRMRNYNVLLACPAGAYISPALLGAASRIWYWNSLARGEALVAATSWSIEGPAPKPILPPLPKAPSPPPPSHLSFPSSTSTCNQQQNKLPYFSTPPFSCPPVPPPFSCPSSSSSSSSTDSPIKLPPLPPETATPAPSISPYSVSSPNFPSVSSTPTSPPAVSSPQSAAPAQVATTKSTEATPSRLNSAVKIVPPESKIPESAPKRDGVAEVLLRLDALLKAYPQGLWLGDLQRRMLLRKIQFDNDFYGHKKLVPYLLTLPRIARVERHLMKDSKTWSYIFFPSTAQASDLSSSKRADYPVEVLSQLNDLFRQHPKGIWLAELNAELVARSIRLETNFYGHGKIVPFLLTLPEMVKIERRYIGDRWSYIFFWNHDGSRKLELTTPIYKKPLPMKKGVVITLRKPENSSSPVVKATADDGATTNENVLTKESVAQDTQVGVGEKVEVDVPEKVEKPSHEDKPFVDGNEHSVEKECALVIVEEQVPTLTSRCAASFFGFFRRIYRRLWSKGRKETLCIEKGNVENVAMESTSLEKPVQEQATSRETPRHQSIRRNRRRIKAVKSRSTVKLEQRASKHIGATSSEDYLRQIGETKMEGAMQASALEAQTIREKHEAKLCAQDGSSVFVGSGQEVSKLEPVIERRTAIPTSIEPMEKPSEIKETLENVEDGTARQEQDVSNLSPSMKDEIDIASTSEGLGGENTRKEDKTEIKTEPVEIKRTIDLEQETLQHVFVREEYKSTGVTETSQMDVFLKHDGKSEPELKQDARDAAGDKEGAKIDFISEHNDNSSETQTRDRKERGVEEISVDQKTAADGVLKLLQTLSEKTEQMHADKHGHRKRIIAEHKEAVSFSSSLIVEQNRDSAAVEEVVESSSIDGTHDIDRVLKLFQSFGGEARESEETPTDDHSSQWHPSIDATKVLDLLKRSTKGDPDQAPDFEGQDLEQEKEWKKNIRHCILDTDDTVPQAAERSPDTPTSKPKRQSRKKKKDANSEAGNTVIGTQELLPSTSLESHADSSKTQTPTKKKRSTKTKGSPPKNTKSSCDTLEKASVNEATQSIVDDPKSEAVKLGETCSSLEEQNEKKENVTGEPSKKSHKKRRQAKDKTTEDHRENRMARTIL